MAMPRSGPTRLRPPGSALRVSNGQRAAGRGPAAGHAAGDCRPRRASPASPRGRLGRIDGGAGTAGAADPPGPDRCTWVGV